MTLSLVRLADITLFIGQTWFTHANLSTHILTIQGLLCIFIFMSKATKALQQLPPSTSAALDKLGADLAVARLRRGESLRSWAGRMGVSVPTLQRLEAGDPGVSIGVVATALWLIQRDGELAKMASPEVDHGALERDVELAVKLARRRARAAAEARLTKQRQVP
ncbi:MULTISPECIES: helix-turn-helix domain-containing protein [Xanthomonas]|uniref:helix-turn-helix domain-containing protein n=1 Tax=Xanthomonas TaxID=338 RepID=UPI000C6589EF|nr:MULTISPECIES: helix-turn-helix transcriptional regulator [Xanthomonas]ATS65874.2 helix-turn-helix domain-containing protein [Xanthomonas citri pv. phaseoli var. fuscans]ATS73967.2 helix-turn-helix domain-containing protein [Xanthomonas citri pv. phaseoli var. fuscans]ATS82249.2 helix-turn-helix domain-containing protein [Xanthomonas citri pv. phaseoli var. fuscans]MCW3192328.1 helix-turn-helix domain-containing protein [Xanthomonas citri pv. fuscans]SOO16145.1 Putative DNA-binding protein (